MKNRLIYFHVISGGLTFYQILKVETVKQSVVQRCLMQFHLLIIYCQHDAELLWLLQETLCEEIMNQSKPHKYFIHKKFKVGTRYQKVKSTYL